MIAYFFFPSFNRSSAHPTQPPASAAYPPDGQYPQAPASQLCLVSLLMVLLFGEIIKKLNRRLVGNRKLRIIPRRERPAPAGLIHRVHPQL